MTRDEILTKAAAALHMEGPDLTLLDDARVGVAVVLDAVEDDIRRDERDRITDWLRKVAGRSDIHGTGMAVMLKAIATELDQRPIEE